MIRIILLCIFTYFCSLYIIPYIPHIPTQHITHYLQTAITSIPSWIPIHDMSWIHKAQSLLQSFDNNDTPPISPFTTSATVLSWFPLFTISDISRMIEIVVVITQYIVVTVQLQMKTHGTM